MSATTLTEKDARKPRQLGRGLSALLGDAPSAGLEPSGDGQHGPREIAVDRMVSGRMQPRRHFDDAAIEALAQSIRENGVLQPLVLRRHADIDGHYEIVAGERRWRAAKRAGLDAVPAVVRDLDDDVALEIGLVENLQREDLSPLEEAEGYRRLLDEFSYTQEKLAQRVGKSRPHVANMLRLLSLPSGVHDLLRDGSIQAGHARAVLGADDPTGLARKIAKSGMSVRQAERLAGGAKARSAGAKARGRSTGQNTKDVDTLALERDLETQLGLSVSIDQQGEGGTLSIHYATLEQLDDLLQKLNGA